MEVNNVLSEVIIRVGVNVKKHRIERGFTQQDLAFYCQGMDRSTITKLETFNAKGFNLNTIVRVSYALGVDVSVLFEK